MRFKLMVLLPGRKTRENAGLGSGNQDQGKTSTSGKKKLPPDFVADRSGQFAGFNQGIVEALFLLSEGSVAG